MGNSNSSTPTKTPTTSGTPLPSPAVPPEATTTSADPPPSPPVVVPPRSLPSVVGYEEFRRIQRDRCDFFTRLAESASVDDVHNSAVSIVVAKNFRLVRPIAHGCNGMVYEVKCIGDGHPELFRDQSYVLKVPFNYGVTTASVQNAFENEYLISSTLEPHPNINQYFCHFTDRLPQEYYDHLPETAKELAFDKEQNRMRAFIWVVLEHHSETVEQFLKNLYSTIAPQNPQATATTPWPIVLKYSRDICAALVHLFVNQTIHFDIKLDNVVVASNKEQAILIDLGCATKFPPTNSRAFETETLSLMSVSGNPSHRAPEIVNGIARYRQKPDRGSMLCCDKQPSFELGCILFELAMFGQHPLPGYPAGGYGPSGKITFSFESEEQFPMKPPAFPREFCNLVRSLLQCDPEKRMPLLEALEVLSNIDPPCPDLLSFYSCVAAPLKSDAGSLTAKSACQILCGYSAKDCVDTLHKALELEPLFSPALLLLHYLKSSCSACSDHCQHQQGIIGALTGKTATFTATDVEFTRAIINKKHRTTLPELLLTALWTRHISNEAETYNNAAQLILQKVPTAAVYMPQQPPSLLPFSRFLRSIIHTRNEMMLAALLQLDLGNIDSALALVADATYLFDCEMMSCINRNETPRKSEYVPGLLLLYCLRWLINNHISLYQQIPPNLLLDFSRALSYNLDMMREHCMSVLRHHTADVIAEWCDLLTKVRSAGNLHEQSHSTTASSKKNEQSWACMYFDGWWRTFCSDDPQTATHIWEELSSLTPVSCSNTRTLEKNHWGVCSLSCLAVCYQFGQGVFKDSRQAMTLFQRAADAGDARAMCCLGVYYENGDVVDRDIHKAAVLYQRAADAGDARALYFLGVCYGIGHGVDKDVSKAVMLYQRAADAGHASSMRRLGACYEIGDGVGKDIHKAVALYQRAADAGDVKAIGQLGVCYGNGNGVDKDVSKAVMLYQRAADAGDTVALCNLGVCYESGNGVDKDVGKALTLYQQAAKTRHPTAMRCLGVCYEKGHGVEKDMSKAVSLYQGAADAGDARAMCNLGACYEKGRGVDKDNLKAITLYQRAADAGCATALFWLGLCYDSGDGVDKDLAKAVTLYQRATDAGHAAAICYLGACYEFGHGVDRDIHKAVALYQQAADAGDAKAMRSLGSCYEIGDGVDKDIHKAVALYQRAADAGDAGAMCQLGSCYKHGNGVDKDVSKAVILYQRAADAGDPMALCNLGVCYDNGTGVDKDIHKAVELYQRAADAGSAKAMLNLGLCYENGDGVDKDIHNATALLQRAADAGDTMAMCCLGVRYEIGKGVDKDVSKAVTLYQRAARLGNQRAIRRLKGLGL
ncbi:serine/threonine protein kinase [Pelomyxa schiedti]|nr:serine/threonine protein kinase [Pelomyxa schiedti]